VLVFLTVLIVEWHFSKLLRFREKRQFKD
jgi:hypothetical protein